MTRADEVAGPTSWMPGQVVLGDYRIDRTLGEGGMGKVVLVQSLGTGQQFAVKTAKLQSPGHRRLFLAELQAWMDLPEHPHLVACRFFRTVGNEVAIFSQFMETGSLADWIASRKLYEGGPERSLEKILDVAIQFAWGLDALHLLGLVHSRR